MTEKKTIVVKITASENAEKSVYNYICSICGSVLLI